MKNGEEKRQEILKAISKIQGEPLTIKNLFLHLKVKRKFKSLTYSSLTYSVKILSKKKKIEVTTTRELHPRRKPIQLISSKKTT